MGIIKSGHESVIEHCSITVKIICDRSCSHQLVRHRIAAFSQESQRYCNYNKLGFEIIQPRTIKKDTKMGAANWVYNAWYDTVELSLAAYEQLIDYGIPPEDARSVLPNAMKTEVVTTFNLRQWRHVFIERALNRRAQWQIREIMLDILASFDMYLPCVFIDLAEKAEKQRKGEFR